MANESLTTWSPAKAQVFQRTFAQWCQGTIPAILQAALEAGPPSTLLDIGCGDGRLGKQAHDLGFEVTLCDREAGMLALARQTCAGLPIEIVEASFPALAAFGDAQFGTAISNFVIHHVRDPQEAVRNMARVVQPGGRVITTVWPDGYNPSREVFLEAMRVVPGVVLPQQDDSTSVISPVERSFEGLAALSEAAGLEIVRASNEAWTWEIARADVWAGTEAGIGATGEHFVAQTPAVQDAIRALVDERLDAYTIPDQPGMLALPCVAALCVAAKA